jgi:DNA-binding transcriptional regulator YhcF (GntR family)
MAGRDLKIGFAIMATCAAVPFLDAGRVGRIAPGLFGRDAPELIMAALEGREQRTTRARVAGAPAVPGIKAPNRDAAVEAVFQPVRRPPTTFEETVERLGTAIRTGLLVAGTKLPPERLLADELRISRSTLRQALATLVQSGHLTSARGRYGGTFVAERPPLSEPEDEPLGRDAWAVLDHRVAIEVGAAILAAERAKRAELDALDGLVERMSSPVDFEAYRRADIRFHIGNRLGLSPTKFAAGRIGSRPVTNQGAEVRERAKPEGGSDDRNRQHRRERDHRRPRRIDPDRRLRAARRL